MISNDCTGSCKFKYHTTTTAQVQLRWKVIVLLILMEFMIITVYKLSFHINQWKELVCRKYVFCWGSLDGICISCEVPSIADTTLGISEQYIFFCHRTGMVGHWIHITFCAQIKLLTSINSILLNQPPMDKWWIKSLCM